MTFSLAAASKSLSKLMPESSPATYGILTLSCLMYAICLLWTMRISGFQMPSGGGLGGLFGFGAINGQVLQRLGESGPLAYDAAQPWLFVTAIFLHGSLIHLGFNMLVLMDIGPMIEEQYGSARYLFIYLLTGICGFVLSSVTFHASVGGSGALLGLMGIVLALTAGRQSASAQMMRGQIIRWLIYVAILGLVPFFRIDNMAHLGGLISGFLLGKIMVDRAPSSPDERKRAQLLGWASALLVIASFAVVLYLNLHFAG